MNNCITLGSYFDFIANKNLNQLAIINSEKHVTYKELNDISNKVANFLIENNVKYGDVIGIFSKKSIICYAAMIASLKIGSPYVHFNDEDPYVRIEKIISKCKPKIILFDYEPEEGLLSFLKQINLNYFILKVESLSNFSNNYSIINDFVVGNMPAYIMFTSGSTGEPKGVAISHDSVKNFISWGSGYLGITSNDRLTQLNPLFFDNSVFDFYCSLFTGASLVVINKTLLSSPKRLIEYISAKECTIWFSTPSLLIYLKTMKVFKKEFLKKIRIIMFGGEGYPKKELKKLYDIYKDRVSFINVYGPTETTCICSAYKVTENDFKDLNSLLPLGEINLNFKYYIVDENLNIVKKRKKGELILGGPNVGLGYYNDAEKTSKSFIQNPFNKFYRDIVYKTGDLVYEEDRLLCFAGRKDNQIKHMGYRIELEEIETALNSLEYIRQSCVLYKRFSERYGKIIAFIILEDIAIRSEKKIINDLAKILPRYMIPNIIKFVEEFPKNLNGKIDRKKLLFKIEK